MQAVQAVHSLLNRAVCVKKQAVFIWKNGSYIFQFEIAGKLKKLATSHLSKSIECTGRPGEGFKD